MTTKELIKLLQEIDPEGVLDVRLGNDILDFVWSVEKVNKEQMDGTIYEYIMIAS